MGMKEISAEDWAAIKPHMEEMSVEAGEVLFHEESTNRDLYFIEEGKIDVIKDGELLVTLGRHEWIGEISALLADVPRTATVKAKSDCKLLILSLPKLKKEVDAPLYLKVIRHLSELIADRLRHSSDKIIASMKRQLKMAETRTRFGQFFCVVLIGLFSFMFVENAVHSLGLSPQHTTFLTAPLILLLVACAFTYVKQSRFGLSHFGVTSKNWKQSLFEGFIWTILIAGAILLIKWGIIYFVPKFHDVSLFTERSLSGFELLSAIIYIAFVPLQEFFARGLLQGQIEHFLDTPNNKLVAIILSNMLFCLVHFQIAFELSVVAFLLGLLWGWLYSRTHNLLGVCVSHALLGFFGLFFLGLLK